MDIQEQIARIIDSHIDNTETAEEVASEIVKLLINSGVLKC